MIRETRHCIWKTEQRVRTRVKTQNQNSISNDALHLLTLLSICSDFTKSYMNSGISLWSGNDFEPAIKFIKPFKYVSFSDEVAYNITLRHLCVIRAIILFSAILSCAITANLFVKWK